MAFKKNILITDTIFAEPDP